MDLSLAEQDESRVKEVDGLTRWMSSHGMAETTRRFRDAVAEQQMTVFAEIDHARAAAEAGLTLLPMQVLFFGSARAGTPLMQSAPTVGIDLPLKALIWSDAEGGTWLAYNDPGWLAARHSARRGNDRVLADMRKVLVALAERVTQLETRPPDHRRGETH
ncbi:MAG TPA: DUF302 domain-containing protein [Acetobacteraceae bacterium]|jgi:uncharacterized protein (DUF302 family)|nr:DUF302 domain-containing protein [Acetobacteraceae bacterium]